MSALTFARHEPRLFWPAWREHGVALGVALALHMGLGFVLLNLSNSAPLTPATPAVIKTQLVSLPAPVEPPPVAAQAPAPAAPPPPVPAPEPVVEAPRVEQADLARKRVQQERREQAQRSEAERQQRREATQRREQLAREEQQRQAHLQQQRLAQARAAEVERQAAAAAARAQAEAASRQYLPIAKQAPDYPQRALDRRIEGECTVVYTVNAQGRVEEPQVAGTCHPLFIKPSLAAAKSFRYQPRIVNGQAVAVANVKNTFSYRIE
ncbi:energy transducer TonB [Phytopseudomonas dryadis]|uniref:Protein TonB n=1 Tax=Phytopseudomonas dryadis TaxID=2487520 RepID=A0A4V6MX59_9GAMM|nr:energy transducer TonB [Pseudomonas dryadis]TBU85168.1 energy transducer TonB [Pseudomonas dryadis]